MDFEAIDWEREDLDFIAGSIWKRWGDVASGAGHEWHTPALATVDPDGGPEARTVVLRRADPGERILTCHTDLRCGKLQSLAKHPQVQWHFYSRNEKVQVRAWADAEVHADDAISERAWEGSALRSRRCYGIEFAPGQELDVPESVIAEDLQMRTPTEEESQVGYRHFSVVLTRVRRMDWLYLRYAGNRRAEFTWDDGWQGRWVVP